MAELKAKTPYETVTGGASGPERMEVTPFVAEEIDPGQLTALAPYKGQLEALSAALEAAHGMAFPKPNRMTGKQGAQALWFGRDMALLIGSAPDASLAAHGAVTDQSDAWSVVDLSGPGAEEVLARLVPVDLRPAVFKRGHTVRTLVGHMSASVTRTGADSFRIMVFRSMVKTLFRELHHAMIGVSARREAAGAG